MNTPYLGIVLCIVLAAQGCGRKPIQNVNVTIMGLSLDSGRQLRQNSLEAFAQETGIHADLIPALGSSAEQLTQTLRLLNQHAGTPDVYVIDVIFPGALGEHLLDLTRYQDAGSHTHLPELLQNDTVQGKSQVTSCRAPAWLNVSRPMTEAST